MGLDVILCGVKLLFVYWFCTNGLARRSSCCKVRPCCWKRNPFWCRSRRRRSPEVIEVSGDEAGGAKEKREATAG